MWEPEEVCKDASLLKRTGPSPLMHRQSVIVKCFRDAHRGPKRLLTNSGALQVCLQDTDPHRSAPGGTEVVVDGVSRYGGPRKLKGSFRLKRSH